MMTAIVQCPNAACGRLSHLGQDPLGRIFRCPRCLTKLPSASASAGDSGWTAILGHPRPRRAHACVDTSQATRSSKLGLDRYSHSARAWKSLAVGSDETAVEGFDLASRYDCSGITNSPTGLGPDDSGEVLVFPVGCSNPVWGAVSRSSMSAVVGDGSISKSVGLGFALRQR